MPLSHDQLRRHARHLVLPEIGAGGQETLAGAKVLVIGAGGLGSAAIGHLAAAGVGRIGIVEGDRVELSNLQRQLLYETADIGRYKAEAAKDRVQEINPDCEVIIFPHRFAPGMGPELVEDSQLVIDCTDNFATRFLIADACLREKKPLVSAAISGFSAQLSTFKPYLGVPHPCYRCLVPQAPEREMDCAQEGIVGPLAGMMGSLQALAAINELLGIGESLSGRLLVFDALSMQPRTARLARDPACAYCA